MAFRFTPPCCCGGCVTCEEIIASGEYRPTILIGDMNSVIEEVKNQTGLDCQYGYLGVYGVTTDGLISGDGGGSTPGWNFISHFDSATGKTEVDTNDNVIWHNQSSPYTPDDLIQNPLFVGYSWLATWKKCGIDFGTALHSTTYIDPETELNYEDNSYDSLSMRNSRGNELARNHGESAEDYAARGIASGYNRASWDTDLTVILTVTFSRPRFSTSDYPNQFFREFRRNYLDNGRTNVTIPLAVDFSGDLVYTHTYTEHRTRYDRYDVTSFSDIESEQSSRLAVYMNQWEYNAQEEYRGFDMIWWQDA